VIGIWLKYKTLGEILYYFFCLYSDGFCLFFLKCSIEWRFRFKAHQFANAFHRIVFMLLAPTVSVPLLCELIHEVVKFLLSNIDHIWIYVRLLAVPGNILNGQDSFRNIFFCSNNTRMDSFSHSFRIRNYKFSSLIFSFKEGTSTWSGVIIIIGSCIGYWQYVQEWLALLSL